MLSEGRRLDLNADVVTLQWAESGRKWFKSGLASYPALFPLNYVYLHNYTEQKRQQSLTKLRELKKPLNFIKTISSEEKRKLS